MTASRTQKSVSQGPALRTLAVVLLLLATVLVLVGLVLVNNSLGAVKTAGVQVQKIDSLLAGLDGKADGIAPLQADNKAIQAAVADLKNAVNEIKKTRNELVAALTPSVNYLEILQVLLGVLLAACVISLLIVAWQNRRFFMLVEDYNGLVDRYRELLASKRIVDAELKQYKDDYKVLEQRLRNCQAESNRGRNSSV